MAVKTNQEYHAVQKEIEFAQTEIKTLEDKMLERMLEADDLTAAVKKAEAELAAEPKKVDAERKAMAAELAELRSSLERIGGERAGVVGSLEPAGAGHLRAAWRSAATASRSPKRATASARSATSACGRRCSTPCGATNRSFSATAATASCISCPPPKPPRRHDLHAAGAVSQGAKVPAGSRPLALLEPNCLLGIVAYIDGGARGNPGPAGYGVRIEQPDGTLVEEFGESIGVATNNVAEYRGLIAALEWARPARTARRFTCDPIRCCSCSRCSATTR